MFNLLSRNIYEIEPDAFGLDISEQSFKLVQLKRDGENTKLLTFGFGDFPKGYIVNGEIKNEDAVVTILTEALNKQSRAHQLTTSHVVCSLPEERSFTRIIQLPNMEEKEAQEAIGWEIEQNIPMGINDVHYDWQFINYGEKNTKHQDVLISAAPKIVVNGLVAVLRQCGLSVKSLEVESLAVSRSVVKDITADEPVLIVDLGATRTSFIIFSGLALQFTSSVPLAGKKMIETIQTVLRVEHEQAKKLFYDVGLDKEKDKKVYAALEPIVRELAAQIASYISFYEGHALHEHQASGPVSIKKVLLCGGVANLTGLNVYLALALKIPVETANPWVNILPDPLREVPGLSYRKSLSYTTVLGLALSGLRKIY